MPSFSRRSAIFLALALLAQVRKKCKTVTHARALDGAKKPEKKLHAAASLGPLPLSHVPPPPATSLFSPQEFVYLSAVSAAPPKHHKKRERKKGGGKREERVELRDPRQQKKKKKLDPLLSHFSLQPTPPPGTWTSPAAPNPSSPSWTRPPRPPCKATWSVTSRRARRA
jgi:hypothetical protein